MNLANDMNRTYPDHAIIDYWTAADGWKIRRFRMEQPSGVLVRGSILFAGGRGDFIEKYLETFRYWFDHGWNIESFDWRGQGGSGRNTNAGNFGHIDDFARWMIDYAAYYSDWEARTPGPHIIMGHSMGGHLMLRALGEAIAQPDAAVLVAPMLGFANMVPNKLGQQAARLVTIVGSPESPGWKHSEKPGALERHRASLLTHDENRYADELFWRAEKSELGLGPATWQWIKAAYDSMIKISQPAFLQAIKTPTFVISASVDKLVDAATNERAARTMPHAEIYTYGPESAHEILREVDAVRNDALARIDRFLDEKAPSSIQQPDFHQDAMITQAPAQDS